MKISRLTNLLLLTSLTILSPAVLAADDNTILAPGQPPLTQGMVNQLIDFFEWALDGKFTAAQRHQFQSERIAEWRNRRQADMDTALQILKIRNQVAGLTPAQRTEIKPTIQGELLKSLQQESNDPTARLLLEVHQSGQQLASSNSPSMASGPGVNSGQPGGDARAALLGEWRSTHMSSINYQNRVTGSYAPPSGNLFELKFQPDGAYVYTGLIQSSMYNCTMSIFGYRTGVLKVQGAKIVLEEKTSKMTSKDNCNQRFNYEKTVPLETKAYDWRIVKDEYGIKLVLTEANGTEYVFYRKTK